MEKLVPFIMAFLYLLIHYELMRLVLGLVSRRTKNRILAYGTASKSSATALFCSCFGAKNVIEGATLPVYLPSGKRVTEIDDLVVLDTCVVVIEIKSHVGTISNPDGPTWHQSVVLRTGEKKELDFVNPYRQNKRHIDAVKQLLRDVPDAPPVYGLIVFTSDRVSFTRQDPCIHRLPKAVELMQKQAGNGEPIGDAKKKEILRLLRRTSKANAAAFLRQANRSTD